MLDNILFDESDRKLVILILILLLFTIDSVSFFLLSFMAYFLVVGRRGDIILL